MVHLSPLAIAGIGFGALAAFTIAVQILWCNHCCKVWSKDRRKRRRRAQRPPRSPRQDTPVTASIPLFAIQRPSPSRQSQMDTPIGLGTILDIRRNSANDIVVKRVRFEEESCNL